MDIAAAIPTLDKVMWYENELDSATPGWIAHTIDSASAGSPYTVAVADIDVVDDQGRLCAIGRGTYSAVVG